MIFVRFIIVMKKVYSAMSGGVDSSVSTLLLIREGYDVTGITMQLLDGGSQAEDAEGVCRKLGISHETVDLRDEFAAEIIDAFARDYEEGRTPNPCTLCNRKIKFGRLLDYIGDAMISTGHYVRIEYSAKTGRYLIRKACYLEKDQSYFLYSLGQEALSRIITPLGEYTKPEVRELAKNEGFVTAAKKESQDVCFINGSYSDFIESYRDHGYKPGDFVDMEGNVLGTHRGIIHYTVGQRKGLGLALKKPMYVHHLDVSANRVVLSDNEELFSRELVCCDFNWVAVERPAEPFRAAARIRYRHKEAPATIYPEKDGSVRIVFDEPQRAITPGQAAVVYYEDIVVGGGRIR